jgi:pyridoxal phosphate enzyme (YggS family)
VSRRDELADNLRVVRERVASACAAVGRTGSDLTVVAVTKTFPASDVRFLANLGLRDVAENRDQEARRKHEECADLLLRWHFVGRLQTNKCRSVASYADVVHSVDRLALVEALDHHASTAGRRLTVLIQVSLDAGARAGRTSAGRGGVDPVGVGPLARAVDAARSLDLGGVMAVAPLGQPADLAYARLRNVADALRSEHPDASIVSAGMSGDLEAAVAHGATHLRIGTALLGHRASQVG